MNVTTSNSPTTRYRLTAPAIPTTPRVAREAVAAWLWAAGHHGLLDTARTLVSDVVTNVVVHTGVPHLSVEAAVTRLGVTVSVWDGDQRGVPRPRRAGADDTCGRGLYLVESLSHAWGVSWTGGAEPAGKRVWFELRAAREGT
ncbi:ATP-binding protein [Streptomyces desertarenae]|uniref:ATP-binding protein n=1 Tax=Streptomyces desertarenae TaxID=2666184 RepID=A0ABW4PHC8_9ACTN